MVVIFQLFVAAAVYVYVYVYVYVTVFGFVVENPGEKNDPGAVAMGAVGLNECLDQHDGYTMCHWCGSVGAWIEAERPLVAVSFIANLVVVDARRM